MHGTPIFACPYEQAGISTFRRALVHEQPGNGVPELSMLQGSSRADGRVHESKEEGGQDRVSGHIAWHEQVVGEWGQMTRVEGSGNQEKRVLRERLSTLTSMHNFELTYHD